LCKQSKKQKTKKQKLIHMKKVSDRHCDGQTYVITNDIGQLVENLRLVGIKTPQADHEIFGRFHHRIKSAVEKALPHLTVVSFDMKRLAEDVWAEAVRIQRNLKDAIVISSCAEMATSRRGHTIEINRIANENGEIIGLGPRPGAVTLEKQLSGIASVADGNPVVLVEDGIFTGSTLLYLVKKLHERRVNVVAVAAGICFPKAVERLRKDFDGELVIVQEVEKPFDWMPDHDFVPFAPNCGRVFGGLFGDDMLPYYTHEGLSYGFPYILPFGDPVKWASIPKEHAHSFSCTCLDEACGIFGMLDEMNGRELTPMDLLGSMPRISIPMSIGSSKLPNPDMPISEFLSDVRQELS
jgi:hypothetical protein